MSQETDLEIFVNDRWVSAGVLRWNQGICDLEMDRSALSQTFLTGKRPRFVVAFSIMGSPFLQNEDKRFSEA